MKKLKEVLEKVYSTPSLRKNIVPLFLGDPGLGKTKIIEAFAEEKGVKLVEFITSQRNPFEISGMAMPDRDIKKMSYWDFDTMLELRDGDILFFDEVLNGNPVVLNACLTILEQRKMISGKELPNVMIIAASNPQGMVPLTPQIKERFVWYSVKFDPDMWREYMFKKYGLTLKMANSLCDLIGKEDFVTKTNNFYSPRSVDKAINMIVNGALTPYADVIEPILSQMVSNPFEQSVTLPNGKVFEENEMMKGIDLIKLKLGIDIRDPEVVEAVEKEEFNEPYTADQFTVIDDTNETYIKLKVKGLNSGVEFTLSNEDIYIVKKAGVFISVAIKKTIEEQLKS